MKLEGQVRIPSGCAISAAISKDGNKMSGEMITNSMKPMHDRSNGLGGGFAGYGIYPEYKDFYAFHMFFDSRGTRKECEAFLKERFEIVHSEIISTRKIPAITNEPIKIFCRAVKIGFCIFTVRRKRICRKNSYEDQCRDVRRLRLFQR